MFLESPRFPDDIAYGATGGPAFSTSVVELNSGYEQRNANWNDSRGEWDVSHGLKNPTDMQTLLNFFRACKGRAHGFRFKDFLDYGAADSNGMLGAFATINDYGYGKGLPVYYLSKIYVNGSAVDVRRITKPVSGTVQVRRGGSAVTVGSSAGNIAISATTGAITFVADASSNASSITVGATTSVVLSANPGALTNGQLLHLSGFTGADSALVNNLAHTINTVSGSGPYTFVLATNTAGKTITNGLGIGKKYPQATEALTWSGEFDVPCRFMDDAMKLQVPTFEHYSWDNIKIIEIRV